MIVIKIQITTESTASFWRENTAIIIDITAKQYILNQSLNMIISQENASR